MSGMFNYPHMCRDKHEEIGHRDSEHEKCPLCRVRDELEQTKDEIAQLCRQVEETAVALGKERTENERLREDLLNTQLTNADLGIALVERLAELDRLRRVLQKLRKYQAAEGRPDGDTIVVGLVSGEGIWGPYYDPKYEAYELVKKIAEWLHEQCDHALNPQPTEQEPLKSHKWTGCRTGGDPADAGSAEYVRYCEVCGMEDTCEDPLPPCPGTEQTETKETQ